MRGGGGDAGEAPDGGRHTRVARPGEADLQEDRVGAVDGLMSFEEFSRGEKLRISFRDVSGHRFQ